MKKIFKYTLIFLQILVVLIAINSVKSFMENIQKNSSLAFSTSESGNINNSFIKALRDTYGNNYKEALFKNEQAVKIANQIALKYLNSETGKFKYPADFGGQYINDDNELVIQIVKNLNIKNSIKLGASSISNAIKYESVSNSYEALEKVNNQIIEYLKKENVENKGIINSYIDVINNVVVVELENNTNEEQMWFKKNVMNSYLIKFIKGNTRIPVSTFYPGEIIKPSNSSKTCSIGYPAKLNGKAGFVTAAHCWDKVGTELNGYGVIKARLFDLSKGIDAEFIELNSGNSVSLDVKMDFYPPVTLKTSNIYPYKVLVVGAAIAKYGYKTGITTGKITSTNAINLVQTNAICDNGDSGGVVFSLDSSGSGTILGIISQKLCKDDECKEPGYMEFSRSDYINAALNLTY